MSNETTTANKWTRLGIAGATLGGLLLVAALAQAQNGVGSACTSNSDCSPTTSNNCVDGVCCDPTCSGTCLSCAQAKTGQPDGTCTQVQTGQQTTNRCTAAGSACSNGACLPAHCLNGTKDADETDVDCGGSCPACVVGKACQQATDCAGSNCVDGVCCNPTNCFGTCRSCAQAKTGLPDGTCGPVTAGQQSTSGCVAAGQACSSSGTCAPAHCFNGVKDGDETDVDCGGPSCASCAVGNACTTSSDCSPTTSDNCIDGVCCGRTCFGDCRSCAQATTGQANGTCAQVLDMNPTTSCPGNEACTSGKCVPTHCFNGVKDGDETDKDCGGSCAGCAVTQNCVTSNDCTIPNCIDGICCERSCFAICHSCALATTGQPNGTCAQVITGMQTTNGCNAVGATCDDLAMCVNPNAQTPTATVTVTPNVTPTTTGTVTPPPCTGDCDGGGTVTVDELLRGANIALGGATISDCPAFDCNGTGQVTVDCVVAAVDFALNGCPH